MFFGGEKFTSGEPLPISARHILRKVFVDDWMMKLIALVITLALWLGVTGLSTPTTTRLSGIPLTLRYANNMEITNSPPQEVDIVISGDKRRVAQLNKGDLVVSVDLTDAPPGERTIQLTPDRVVVTLPTGIKLDEIQPTKIAVRLEPVEEKDVAVQIETQGELAEGFEIYNETISPQRVRVRGPAAFLRSLISASTEPIDITGRNGDFSVSQVPVDVSNPKATVLDTVVDVSFRIGERRVERTYVVAAAGETEGNRAAVVLFGPRSILDVLNPDEVSVEISKNENGDTINRLLLPAAIEGSIELRRLRLQE